MSDLLLRLTDISFAYPDQEPVLRNLSLSVQTTDRIGIQGANGSGKTTLLHLMVGLIRPQAGNIWAFGKEAVCEKDFVEVRKRIGLLFQDPEDQLFCPTVEEDIAFGLFNLGKTRAEVRTLVLQTIERFGLQGLEHRVTHRLSGGEKKLVSLAGVMAMEPDILLLDEPVAGLDNETRAMILSMLKDMNQTMVVISHTPDVLEELTSSVCRLDHGCLKNTE